MIAVTTFPWSAWNIYAKRFVTAFLQHWPLDLVIYADDADAIPRDMPLSPRIEIADLSDIPGHDTFVELARRRRHTRLNTFLFDAARFCHKVFAQMETCDQYDTVFWLDADIVTHKPVTASWLAQLLGPHMCCYLGRENTFSETGFVGFNTCHPDFDVFRQRYLAHYLEGGLFALPAWVDSLAFDQARAGLSGNNLSRDGKNFEHVFITSVLGEYMDHMKGHRKFLGVSPEWQKQRLSPA